MIVPCLACCVTLFGPRDHDPVPMLPPKSGKSEKFVLFNGKDLDSWEGLTNKYWSARDGMIVGKSEDELKVSTFLVTRKRFNDFHLSLAVRVLGSATRTGIAFWGEVVPNRGDPFAYKGHLFVFPKTWGLYETFGRGNLGVDPRPILAAARARDWNDIEIFAQGNRVRVVFNGVFVIDWRDPEPHRIREGPIALQLHASELPQEVQFKDLHITTFPDDTRLKDRKVGESVPPADKRE